MKSREIPTVTSTLHLQHIKHALTAASPHSIWHITMEVGNKAAREEEEDKTPGWKWANSKAREGKGAVKWEDNVIVPRKQKMSRAMVFKLLDFDA